MACQVCDGLRSEIKDKEDYIAVCESKRTAASYSAEEAYRRVEHLKRDCEIAKAAFDQDAHNPEKSRRLGAAQDALKAASDAATDAQDRVGEAVRERGQYVDAKKNLEWTLQAHTCPSD